MRCRKVPRFKICTTPVAYLGIGDRRNRRLQILQHTNNNKRNNKELLVVADVFRLLCICVFSYRCFLFHCLYLFIFPGYAQEISLCDFFHST